MAYTAAQLIRDVRSTLFDPAGTRWSDAELLKIVNNVQSVIASKDLKAATKTKIAHLQPGYLQELPAGYRSVVKMPRSIAGLTPAVAGLLVAERHTEGSVTLHRVTAAGISTVCEIPFSAGHAMGSTYSAFSAAKLGGYWYCILSGGYGYGGDLYRIDSAGVFVNMTPLLGMAWTAENFGPNSIVQGNNRLLLGMNQPPYLKTSTDGLFWQTPATTATSGLYGMALGGSNGALYAGNGTAIGATQVALDGETYQDAVFGIDVTRYLSAWEGGILAVDYSGTTLVWADADGNLSAPVTLETSYSAIADGNLSGPYGDIPLFGVFTQGPAGGGDGPDTALNLLLKDTSTDLISCVRAPTLASLADGTAPVTAITNGYGFGCWDLGDGHYVAVLSTGIYRTTDFKAFTLALAPSAGYGYDADFIGAGGLVPSSVTLPTGWA